MNNKKVLRWMINVILLFTISFNVFGCSENNTQSINQSGGGESVSISGQLSSDNIDEIPEYTGEPYVIINDNNPDFSSSELTEESYEEYGELDELGRCQTAIANIGEDLMPTEERGKIGQVKPTGWHTVKYDNIDGMYLYNRCHLIGYQLTGENANEENLITGTRYMNVDGMLPFEDMTADYIEETGNHVLYRVTPVYEGDNLVVSGVQMEAESVEDEGEGICYNVFVYNVQPGISIDYETGESEEADEDTAVALTEDKTETTYILNTNTKKYHLPSCSSVKETKEKNRKEYTGTKEELEKEGYEPCGRCKP
ncbi:MAG: DNA/RNA non-specific endonuclease [Lachnospiraceae bacterium]|nr:DNA/RNA non-specific endonuclease [Lachnospiraceae bacterium]